MIGRIAILIAIIVGVYFAYQSPTFRPQLDELRSRFLVAIHQAEEQLNSNIQINNSGNLPPTSINVVVPRSKAQDWQQVGAMGRQILNPAGKTLKVEIDYSTSSKPTDTYISTLSSVLSKYSTSKPQVYSDSSNIEVKSSYSLQDVVEITKNNRSCYSNDSQVCMYVLALPGSLEGSSALGAAFSSTGLVLFPGQFKKATSFFGDGNRIAQATITHELGHIFGLVGLISPSKRIHDDSSHPGHSTNPGSVMYWAVEDMSLSNLLGGGPPVNFDSDDEYDIYQIKEAK